MSIPDNAVITAVRRSVYEVQPYFENVEQPEKRDRMMRLLPFLSDRTLVVGELVRVVESAAFALLPCGSQHQRVRGLPYRT